MNPALSTLSLSDLMSLRDAMAEVAFSHHVNHNTVEEASAIHTHNALSALIEWRMTHDLGDPL